MLELAILIKASTLRALAEHSTAPQLGGALPLNESESLMIVSADSLRRLLDLARPEDTRIDEVILRLAL
jgi:hypothetical protein